MNERFERDGFLLVEGFRTQAQMESLRERAEQLAAGFDAAQAAIFTTKNQAANSEAYFLESADKIRCFYEEDGRTPNKLGHAMHDLDPVFEAFSHGPDLANIAREAGLGHPAIYQSMYIFKNPRVGGEVRWHQDATFFDTSPQSVTAFWFALDDADRTNGCLWVQPGGHRGPLRERFTARDGKAQMQTIDAVPWPAALDAVPLEVRAGTLVVFDGLLPHYSAANTSNRPRHAYTLHAVDSRSAYSPLNWLQRNPSFAPRGF